MIPLIFLSVSVFAESQPTENTVCQRDRDHQLDTAAGPFFFGIHPKKADAPKKCSASISVVFRVGNFETSLLAAKSKGLLPDSTEKDPDQGQFAHFHDPDGNEVTIWGK